MHLTLGRCVRDAVICHGPELSNNSAGPGGSVDLVDPDARRWPDPGWAGAIWSGGTWVGPIWTELGLVRMSNTGRYIAGLTSLTSEVLPRLSASVIPFRRVCCCFLVRDAALHRSFHRIRLASLSQRWDPDLRVQSHWHDHGQWNDSSVPYHFEIHNFQTHMSGRVFFMILVRAFRMDWYPKSKKHLVAQILTCYFRSGGYGRRQALKDTVATPAAMQGKPVRGRSMGLVICGIECGLCWARNVSRCHKSSAAVHMPDLLRNAAHVCFLSRVPQSKYG